MRRVERENFAPPNVLRRGSAVGSERVEAGAAPTRIRQRFGVFDVKIDNFDIIDFNVATGGDLRFRRTPEVDAELDDLRLREPVRRDLINGEVGAAFNRPSQRLRLRKPVVLAFVRRRVKKFADAVARRFQTNFNELARARFQFELRADDERIPTFEARPENAVFDGRFR